MPLSFYSPIAILIRPHCIMQVSAVRRQHEWGSRVRRSLCGRPGRRRHLGGATGQLHGPDPAPRSFLRQRIVVSQGEGLENDSSLNPPSGSVHSAFGSAHLLRSLQDCAVMSARVQAPWGLVAALLLLVVGSRACSDVLVACGPYAQAPASARTLD